MLYFISSCRECECVCVLHSRFAYMNLSLSVALFTFLFRLDSVSMSLLRLISHTCHQCYSPYFCDRICALYMVKMICFTITKHLLWNCISLSLIFFSFLSYVCYFRCVFFFICKKQNVFVPIFQLLPFETYIWNNNKQLNEQAYTQMHIFAYRIRCGGM